MKKITIDQNGTYKINVPEWAAFTVVYGPLDHGGATIQLESVGVPLANGTVGVQDQLKINHGFKAELDIVVTGFVSSFDLHVTYGE